MCQTLIGGFSLSAQNHAVTWLSHLSPHTFANQNLPRLNFHIISPRSRSDLALIMHPIMQFLCVCLDTRLQSYINPLSSDSFNPYFLKVQFPRKMTPLYLTSPKFSGEVLLATSKAKPYD